MRTVFRLRGMRRTSLVCLWWIATVGCQRQSEVVIFHAPSLSEAFSIVGRQFRAENEQIHLHFDVSGSQTAARKISQLGMRADVVGSADAAVIDQILIPDHATWCLHFAAGEIVLVHGQHSPQTEAVTAENWYRILLRSEVRLGLVNPDLGPLGYRSLFVWQLAALDHPDDPAARELSKRLRDRVTPEHLAADEGQLLALLSARAIDFAMMYRSTAEKHRLKMTRLPARENLGDPDHAADYARAAVPVLMSHGAPRVLVRGTPIVFGLTIPTSAPHPELAERFVRFLLSESGRRGLLQAGLQPLVPPRIADRGALPPGLRDLVPAGGAHK